MTDSRHLDCSNSDILSEQLIFPYNVISLENCIFILIIIMEEQDLENFKSNIDHKSRSTEN